jgi:hypothetical protein
VSLEEVLVTLDGSAGVTQERLELLAAAPKVDPDGSRGMPEIMEAQTVVGVLGDTGLVHRRQ